jgi:beta-galactosidase
MTRRDWLKAAGAIGGAAWLPNVTGVLGLERGQATSAASAGRERLLADFGWRFHLGHANDPAQDFGFGQGRVFDKVGRLFAPSGARFDDSSWRAVDLPHDWAVELPFENSAELVDFGCKPLGRNYPATSIGWYRRVFDIPASDTGRRVAIEFDGVFRNATVALNGHLLGTNFSGYAPFRYDISDLVTYGGANVLVVRVDATEREGWFYEGAGIYRHVWLEKTAPLHVGHWGTFVTAEVARDSAMLTIRTDVVNDSDRPAPCRVVLTIRDPDGRTIADASSAPLVVGSWDNTTVAQSVSIPSPKLWAIDTPHLHTLVTTIERADAASAPVDAYDTPFGIRTIRFEPEEGFFLNGSRVTVKGTCNHQDHAGVGSALPDALQDFRIARLKSMGSNAYRTAHNPPTPQLLDACDRLGMLVLDESRLFSSNDEGHSQLDRLIRRDRNHPSVFAWSIANEEWSDQAVERGRRIADSLRRTAHALDPTRPVVAAMDSGYENARGISLAIDVQGFNYQRENIDAFHQKFPTQPSMGTETASAYSTRGIYAADEARGYVSAYDVNKPSYGATAEEWWKYYAARRFLAGGFIWTGFDYRGEPSPYKWPCINSHFGVLDTCGFPKDTFYYYKSWWSNETVLHLFPHWNWAGREGQAIEVWCFTNLDRVELFVNGVSAGARQIQRNSHAMWRVPYAAGVIEARGVKDGTPVTSRRETTGNAARILLRPDRVRLSANGEDVSVVEAYVVDARDRLVPTADQKIAFTASAGGRIIGVGNGNPSCHEPDHATERSAFNGLCLALVQATRTAGSIRVEATSPGLESATVVIDAVAASARPALG